MKKVCALLLALLMTALLLPSAMAADTVHTLRVATVDTPDTKNPMTTLGMGSKQIYSRQVYEVLIDLDQDLNFMPVLAKEWSVSEDNLIWTFNLRDDVYWHDGEKFTADDVVYTYEAMMKFQLGVYYATIDGITAVTKVDDYTVTFTTEKPMVNMISAMLFIVPEHIFAKYDTPEAMSGYANDEMIGTGPFKLEKNVDGEYVKYVRNDSYWGEIPKIDELIYVFFANTDTMVQAFESGEIDFMDVDSSQLAHVEKLSYAGIHTYNQLGFTQICLNSWEDERSNGNPLMLDPQIRTALDWAIDRTKIIEYAKGGLATNCVTVIPDSAGKWHWQPDADTLRSYNPEKAKEVLEAAGYTDRDGDGIREDAEGNKLLFRFTCMEKHRNIGLILQSNWEAVGIQTDIAFVDSARQSQLVYSEDFNTDIMIWGWGVRYDPSFILYHLTSAAIEKSSDCYYGNPEYDALYAKQNEELDEEKRLEMVYEMQQIIYRDAPYIPLFMEYYVEAYRADRFEGFIEWPKDNAILNIYSLKVVTPVE